MALIDASPITIVWLRFAMGVVVLGWVKVFGILLAFIGVLVVVSDGDMTSISIGKLGAPGDVLILISAVNWAVFSTLSR